MLVKIAKSKWFDLLGIAIVIIISIASGYLTETLADVVNWGSWTRWVPFGIISIFNTVLSVMSTRLTGRMLNSGNIVGIINTVLSGTIDYLLGNKAAVITYPITFIIYVLAINKWKNSEKYKASKPLTGRKGLLTVLAILLVSFVFSYLVNYAGYQGKISLLFWLTTIVFGLSMAANILNAMKLSVQWSYWFIYNIAQLIKAFVQGNFANVGKYIYYIINAVAAASFWKKPA
ncbi:nicotinamide mononucleotide transporter family protein [Bombilactobacillus thymidiniphilus]|uniref:Nicotinamide mononucleotide transporter family protein n=1 Tax=Bombilactobacillus thymidiniphilus TaxID=2923363 RepID=A0ABY4PBH0_9LACO|nr:nicotinamide mononucleotide transporter family protein [Bombilactobacillus thymidiniphilus]UQS83120.1 nicotinamide mononucleotide transporter family protein [Bombilactobacillus thymidiniphilus]